MGFPCIEGILKSESLTKRHIHHAHVGMQAKGAGDGATMSPIEPETQNAEV